MTDDPNPHRGPRWLERIVSGAQTGVDQAALDVAITLGVPYGGWVPAGRRNEAGVIPPHYEGLRETDSKDYAVRTKANVRDSDATLVVTWGAPTGGTKLTVSVARRMGRRVHVADLEGADALQRAITWLEANRPAVLNVAGPRESGRPFDVAERASQFLADLLGA